LAPVKLQTAVRMKTDTGNLAYNTVEIERYFSQNRIRWDQFYESERVVIEHIWPGGSPEILDIGCGCGGLGLALLERFDAERYTGIEIHAEAAASAARLNRRARILSGDFLDLPRDSIAEASYDLVFSLSCIDWNLSFENMLAKAWAMVRPGGTFVASFRLATDGGVNDISKSYQYINYAGKLEGEIAPYVVLNAGDLIRRVKKLAACRIFGYGYYGPPGKTAVTPYRELCFAALAIGKPANGESGKLELTLPKAIADQMAAAW
jgi:SAM-dependent methyltransferase